MRGLPSILSLFPNELNKCNINTGVRMLDSIYHMTLKLLKNENVKISPSCTHCYNGHHYVSRKSVTTSGISILLHGVISLADATSCDKRNKGNFCVFHYSTLCLLASSADIFCKHFNPDQARQNVGPD